jgi:hypothetical protein
LPQATKQQTSKEKIMSKSSIRKFAFDQANRACRVEPMANGQYRAVWPSNGFMHEGRACSYNVAKGERARAVAVRAMELLGYDAATIGWALPLYSYGKALDMFYRAIKNAGPVRLEQN